MSVSYNSIVWTSYSKPRGDQRDCMEHLAPLFQQRVEYSYNVQRTDLVQRCVSESPCVRKHKFTGPEIPVPQYVSDESLQVQIERMSTAIGRQVTYPMFDRPTPKSVLEYKDQQLSS